MVRPRGLGIELLHSPCRSGDSDEPEWHSARNNVAMRLPEGLAIMGCRRPGAARFNPLSK